MVDRSFSFMSNGKIFHVKTYCSKIKNGSVRHQSIGLGKDIILTLEGQLGPFLIEYNLQTSKAFPASLIPLILK